MYDNINKPGVSKGGSIPKDLMFDVSEEGSFLDATAPRGNSQALDVFKSNQVSGEVGEVSKSKS